jgi:hypothetical protein
MGNSIVHAVRREKPGWVVIGEYWYEGGEGSHAANPARIAVAYLFMREKFAGFRSLRQPAYGYCENALARCLKACRSCFLFGGAPPRPLRF